jgi:hypothetical protein
MRSRITSIATMSLAGLLSLSAWAQVASPGGGGAMGGPNATAPSGAAITHTPGTPGASDTPAALQSSHVSDSAPTLSPAELRKLKKQARKASDSSAPLADTSKTSSSAPPR